MVSLDAFIWSCHSFVKVFVSITEAERDLVSCDVYFNVQYGNLDNTALQIE